MTDTRTRTLTYPGPHPDVTVAGLGRVVAGDPVAVACSTLARRLLEQGWAEITLADQTEPELEEQAADTPADPPPEPKSSRSRR